MVAPAVERSAFNKPFFKRNKYNQNELRQSKITIITDADVDQHELDIPARRIQRK